MRERKEKKMKITTKIMLLLVMGMLSLLGTDRILVQGKSIDIDMDTFPDDDFRLSGHLRGTRKYGNFVQGIKTGRGKHMRTRDPGIYIKEQDKQ